MSEKPNHYDTRPSKRDLFDLKEDEDDYCEHGLLFDEDCVACSAIYEDYAAETGAR